jgi:hypothetical protein
MTISMLKKVPKDVITDLNSLTEDTKMRLTAI